MREKQIKVPYFKGHFLPNMFFLVCGLPKGSIVSIDVTKKCNLRCKHCYFFQSQHQEELSSDEWENRMKRLKSEHPLLYTATWIGGEPLLRPDVIERCKKYFTHNLVVTNGTVDLPRWPKMHYNISIDGDEQTHDMIRGQKGLYSKIIKNIADKPELRISGAMCINSLNKNTIGKVLEDFYDSNLSGFLFDFYTPMIGTQDELYIGGKEKDEILDQLIEYKKGKYADLIYLPVANMEYMKSYNMHRTVNKCPFKRKGIALDTSGNVKSKCMMGKDADCSKCGCVVPYFLHYKVNRKEIIRAMVEEIGDRLSGRGCNI